MTCSCLAWVVSIVFLHLLHSLPFPFLLHSLRVGLQTVILLPINEIFSIIWAVGKYLWFFIHFAAWRSSEVNEAPPFLPSPAPNGNHSSPPSDIHFRSKTRKTHLGSWSSGSNPELGLKSPRSDFQLGNIFSVCDFWASYLTSQDLSSSTCTMTIIIPITCSSNSTTFSLAPLPVFCLNKYHIYSLNSL